MIGTDSSDGRSKARAYGTANGLVSVTTRHSGRDPPWRTEAFRLHDMRDPVVRNDEVMEAGVGLHDPGWSLLDVAKPLLLNRLGEHGVEQIEYVGAFPDDAFSVWLCTQTDSERDAMGSPGPLLDAVRATLMEAGFTPDQVTGVRTVTQSQETVDRDYEGSWFYAMQ